MPTTLDVTYADPALEAIREKLAGGKRLDKADGLALLRSPDLIGVGRLADHAVRARHGRRVLFVLNRQINPTNVCVYTCKFCEFAARPGDAHAYEMTREEVQSKVTDDLREVHIVGGLHNEWPFERYVDIVRAVKEKNPRVQVKAYTAVEIFFFSRLARLSVEEVLRRLKDAGLDAMPGGGAEVFSARVKKLLFPGKIGADQWLDVHRTAHRLGIRSNSTLLYGHIETHEERVDHMLRLRELQDETGGFFSFIPLAFQPGTTNLVERPASALEDLKTIATARLLLDNVPHIKAYWIMLGEDTASIALAWGASDIDGTVGEERIAHAALAPTPLGLARERIIAMIREAGRVPVERDALYNEVAIYDGEPEEALGGRR
jgi:aminodeoxyfutalosine synthase